MPDYSRYAITGAVAVIILFLAYLIFTAGEDAEEASSPPSAVEEPSPDTPQQPVTQVPEEGPDLPEETPQEETLEPEPVIQDEGEEVAETEDELPVEADEEQAAVQEPEPEPEPETEPEPEVALPDLNESDEFLLSRLSELEGGDSLTRLLVSDEIIRKFVILTENARNGLLPQRDLPVRRIEDPIEVQRVGEDEFIMQPSSYRRFDFFVDTFMAIDTEEALSLYMSLLPLLQEAYAELGHPDQDFNQVVIDAIDTVLEARTFEGPFQLERPSVVYEYADERIESLNDVEKLLLRMGPENRNKFQEKLREFRAGL